MGIIHRNYTGVILKKTVYNTRLSSMWGKHRDSVTFFQQLIQANNKEYTQYPHHCPFVRRIHPSPGLLCDRCRKILFLGIDWKCCTTTKTCSKMNYENIWLCLGMQFCFVLWESEFSISIVNDSGLPYHNRSHDFIFLPIYNLRYD